MWFKAFYTIYLTVCLLFSNISVVSGLSLRHILTLVMFIVCFVKGGVRFDRFLKYYLLFLLCYGMSCLLTGYGDIFIKNLFGTFFAAIVLYFSTIVLIKDYNGGVWIVYTVLAIALFNALIAIGQFYGNPYAMGVTTFFSFNIGEGVMDMYENHSDLHGRYVSGMFDVVNNGYFMSAASILALFNKKGKLTFFNIVIFLPILYALFLCQERSGFYGGILCVALYLYLMVKKNRSMIILFSLVAIVIAYVLINHGGQLISIGEMRYNTVEDEGLRWNLIENGWHYFLEHPLGAYQQWVAEGNQQTHNIIINALLLGGLFGGLIGIGIIISQVFKIVKILINTNRNFYSPLLVVLAIAYLDYTLNSLFHNPSLLAGISMYFVLWGAIVSLNKEGLQTS